MSESEGTVDDIQKGCFGSLLIFFMATGIFGLFVFLFIQLVFAQK